MIAGVAARAMTKKKPPETDAERRKRVARISRQIEEFLAQERAEREKRRQGQAADSIVHRT